MRTLRSSDVTAYETDLSIFKEELDALKKEYEKILLQRKRQKRFNQIMERALASMSFEPFTPKLSLKELLAEMFEDEPKSELNFFAAPTAETYAPIFLPVLCLLSGVYHITAAELNEEKLKEEIKGRKKLISSIKHKLRSYSTSADKRERLRCYTPQLIKPTTDEENQYIYSSFLTSIAMKKKFGNQRDRPAIRKTPHYPCQKNWQSVETNLFPQLNPPASA
jgi:hypothetical protein